MDVLSEMRAGWADASAGERLHAVWLLVNDILSLALVLAVLLLFLVSAGPGFPTAAWSAVIVAAVLWLVSIVVVDPVVDRLVYE